MLGLAYLIAPRTQMT